MLNKKKTVVCLAATFYFVSKWELVSLTLVYTNRQQVSTGASKIY